MVPCEIFSCGTNTTLIRPSKERFHHTSITKLLPVLPQHNPSRITKISVLHVLVFEDYRIGDVDLEVGELGFECDVLHPEEMVEFLEYLTC